jgi:hypothetical protein
MHRVTLHIYHLALLHMKQKAASYSAVRANGGNFPAISDAAVPAAAVSGLGRQMGRQMERLAKSQTFQNQVGGQASGYTS